SCGGGRPPAEPDPPQGGDARRSRGAGRAVPAPRPRVRHARGLLPPRVSRSRVRRMPGAEAMSFDDAYTGFLTHLSPIPGRAGDPEVSFWGGIVPPWGPRDRELSLGGAGWTDDDARGACVGEAIERFQAYALPADEIVESSCADWPLDEPAVGPEGWVLFHPDQYRSRLFPFAPFSRDTRCRWVCFREAGTGSPRWIPEEFGFLFHAAGDRPRISLAYSTGLSCGRSGHPILLRGLQEAIE